MKILYVDINTLGHHISYISALINGLDNEVVAVLPEKIEGLSCKQYKYKTSDRKNGKRSLGQYKKWLNEILDIANLEKPDVIHFLYGDFFYRYFGYGLRKFKKYKTIVVFHALRYGFLNVLSAKCIASCVDRVVVHSEYLINRFRSYGKTNGVHIEYPNFNKYSCEKNESKDFFGLDSEIPVLGCIGETRFEKGLDILLEALKFVKKPFQLLVAGKPVHFEEDFIKELVVEYEENTRLLLKFLSDEELAKALQATDIIVLPYRKNFNAASGPLIEGVSLGKCIVAPKHGNLGDVVTQNHLGYIFESEDIQSLAETIEKTLETEFILDSVYKSHQETLELSHFLKSYDYMYKNF